MLFILLCTSFVCGLSIRGSGFSRNRRSRASHCPRSQLGRCQARADIIVFGTAQPFVTGRIMIEKSPENQPDETDGAGQDECPLPPPMNGDPGDQQRRHDRADHRARIIKSGGQRRSFCGNHSATVLLAAGKLPDSPTPSRARAIAKPAVPVAKPCSTAAMLQTAKERP